MDNCCAVTHINHKQGNCRFGVKSEILHRTTEATTPPPFRLWLVLLLCAFAAAPPRGRTPYGVAQPAGAVAPCGRSALRVRRLMFRYHAVAFRAPAVRAKAPDLMSRGSLRFAALRAPSAALLLRAAVLGRAACGSGAPCPPLRGAM